jgi:FAD/FMN-containing dehydrogenase
MTLPGTDIVMATVNAECGVVTRRLGDLAKTQDLVFAVDPTSQDASTIGGNVAMNAGGGKAVLWGTTLDNLVSWRMVTPRGTWQEIVRQNHNVSKIHLQDNTTFSITEYAADGKTPLADPTLLTIPGASLRKEGLGKDVTDKFLSGLPGVQKEGCDGLITSARFILHKPPQHIRTVCMEFFGDNLQKAVPAIVEIKNYLDALPEVLLSGLEHLDERYIKAVKYTTKVTRAERPKMILLADIVSDNENALNAAAAEMVRLTNLRNGEGFTASSSAARAIFWLDRTRTAAIATHTNAFKINEDVVIPLPRLGEYNNSIERINIEYSLGNKLAMLATQLTFLQALADKHSEQPLLLEKINAAYSIVIQTQKQWQIIANDLDTYFIELQSRTLRISYKTTISKPLLTIFAGEEHSGIRDSLN